MHAHTLPRVTLARSQQCVNWTLHHLSLVRQAHAWPSMAVPCKPIGRWPATVTLTLQTKQFSWHMRCMAWLADAQNNSAWRAETVIAQLRLEQVLLLSSTVMFFMRIVIIVIIIS